MYIAIDLGGTNIKAGIVTEEGKILNRLQVPTEAKRHYSEIIKDMAGLGISAAAEAGVNMEEIKSVGIGSPGTVDNKRGYLVYTNNINFYDVPMREEMQKYIPKPIYMGNDANCACWGEYKMLNHKGKNFVFITLGTGVGGGVVVDGKLQTGFNGAGYELGHTVIQADGIPCTCGQKGCWESYASVTALIRMTVQAMKKGNLLYEMCEGNPAKVSGRTAFLAEREGDAAGKAVVDAWVHYIAVGVCNMVNIFQPETLSIGGAISKEGDRILLPVREYVEQNRYSRSVPQTEITIAQLGNDAGLIGAAFLEP